MLQGRISGPLHAVGLSQGQHIAYKVLHKTAPEGPDAFEAGTRNVDRFLAPCDFFTIDVADSIGQAPSDFVVQSFIEKHPELVGDIAIEKITEPFHITRQDIESRFRAIEDGVKDQVQRKKQAVLPTAYKLRSTWVKRFECPQSIRAKVDAQDLPVATNAWIGTKMPIEEAHPTLKELKDKGYRHIEWDGK